MKYVILLVLLAGFYSSLSAQESNTLIGRILEKSSQAPMEFVTIKAMSKKDSLVVAGTTTDSLGNFSLSIPANEVFVKVSMMGFDDLYIDSFEFTNGISDLGTLKLRQDTQNLDDVYVRAEKSQTVFKLDKRIFNVGKDLSSSGSSALEILNNVPSVEVTLEGAISLRGNANVQILINGKPSVLANGSNNALGTITADMIDRIEVITNPSAKYDAEGTSGIINIVLKKEKKRGTSGSATINTGFPNNHSLGLSLNHRTEKFNVFAQFGVGRRTFLTDINGESVNYAPSYSRLSNTGKDEKNETFINVVLGTDFHINERNLITLSGHYAYEWEDQYATTYYEQFNETANKLGGMRRSDITTATNPKWQYDLRYAKTFKDNKEHLLTLSASGSSFAKDKQSSYTNDEHSGNFDALRQRSGADFAEAQYIFQVDYVHPLPHDLRFDLGAKYQLDDIRNNYTLENNENDLWISDSAFTNEFLYNQGVVGGYASFAWERKKFGIQAGLRYEETLLKTELKTTGEKNDQQYGNFFPSAHISYAFTKRFSMQLAYSRRISRPELWDLNPFSSLRDNYNISTGNPKLAPELTNSLELATIKNWDKLSFNAVIFYSTTTDVISDWVSVENNVSTTSPQNIGNSNTLGLELSLKYTPKKWFSLLTDANTSYFNRVGRYQNTDFDFNSSQWSVRMLAKFKLKWGLDLQWSMRYSSPEKGVFQDQKENYFADAGIRKKVLKKRGVINFSVRDVFATRVYATTASRASYSLESSRKRGRYIVLGFSYSFGKGEAMEFSGHKMF